jgi:hypothetical protein
MHCAVFHRRREVLVSNDDFDVPPDRITGEALVQNCNQARFLFQGAHQQFTQLLTIGKLRLSENVECAVDINFSREAFFAFRLSSQSRMAFAQEFDHKAFLGLH